MLSRQAMLAARTATASASAPRLLTAATPAAMRTFAAAASPDSKPPVALFGIDGTYASALYTAAVKSESLAPTAKSLAALGSLLRKDPKLVKILATPTLSPADKLSIVAELQKASGTAGEATVTNFLKTLADNNRLGLLDGVVGKFAELIRAAQGQVELVVTSAAALDGKTLARLESAVAKSPLVGTGKKLSVKNKVNPEILGGLIVEVGDRTIDLSVLARVGKLNKLLTDSL